VKGFSVEQVLDELLEMLVYIHTLSSLIRLDSIAYLVDNLRAGVLIGTDTLARAGASIDLKRKKLNGL